METRLITRNDRKKFYPSFLLFLLILILLRLFVIPSITSENDKNQVYDIINSTLDALFSTSFATVAIAELIGFFIPNIIKISRIETIEPIEIKKEFRESLSTTTSWHYRGGCGRYNRSVTIPELGKRSLSDNVTHNITIQIIDPSNSELCMKYSDYRNSLKSARTNKWSPQKVKIDLLATIAICYINKNIYPKLEIKIGLLQTFSIWRIDLSDKQAIITKEEKSESALKCVEKTLFYNSYNEDLLLSLKHSKILEAEQNKLQKDNLSIQSLRSFFNKLKIGKIKLSDLDYQEIIKIIEKPVNPYD